MKTRISLVHYLNSAPLGWAFLHGPFRDDFEVIPSSPADCADQLASGEVDIGLIPSIEYQRIPGLKIIPGVCISSLASVRSLLLIKPKGLETIRSVAMDTCSRTSVTLGRILLQVKLGIRPEYVPHPPDPKAMLENCDAALVIGDPALKINPEDYDTLDLAEEWVGWQNRPFVTALWGCRDDVLLPDDLTAVFQEAKNWGLQRRREIAESFAELLSLPAAFLDDYLRNNIDYDLSLRHIEGLTRFYELARDLNLIPEVRPLQFISE